MRKAIFGAIAALFVVVALVVGAWFYPVLTISQFAVTGQVETTQEEIDAVISHYEGENFVSTSSAEIAQSFTALPWVTKAHVSKTFPAGVKVALTEHTAAMYVQRGDGTHLIENSGQVFVIDEPPQGAVLVVDSGEDDQVLFAAIGEVLASLTPENRALVVEVDARDELSLILKTQDEKQITWGANENNHDKAIAFTAALHRPEMQLDISGAPTVSVR